MTSGERNHSGARADPAVVAFAAGPTETLVRDLSERLREPEWMLRMRLRALEKFRSQTLPPWSEFLGRVDFSALLESRVAAPEGHDASPTPGGESIAESEAAYRAVRQDLESRGVRFLRTDLAMRRYPDLFREGFAAAVSPEANSFAALNAAFWTAGSFVYVPPGVRIETPLQAEIREDYGGVEPFERHIVVADRGAQVTYIEGCTAPVYTPEQLHVSAVEVVARPESRVRYIALQNFAKEVDNLVTKRAVVHERALVEWVDANLGSRHTWKIPETELVGRGAAVEVGGLALAGGGQRQDVGGAVLHRAPETSAQILERAVLREGGRATVHAEVRALKGASSARAKIDASALLLDAASRSETVPAIEVDSADVEIVHEGRVQHVSDDMVFYLTSRGLTREEAVRILVLGSAEDITRRIPLEYAVEVSRLIELELGGAVG